MHKRQLRAPSPAFVISLIALFVALGGTTYAATSLPKNSVGTKQIKKNAVTGVKIKNGAVTAAKINTNGLTVQDAIYATSADSASTATNATNAIHATSADSASTATNATNLGGTAAREYLHFGGTLPSGVTESGAWGFGTNDGTGGGGSIAQPVVTFRVPLAAGLDAAHAIYVSGTSATHCPGTGHAAAGYLCVYQGDIFNADTPSSPNIFNPELAGAPAGIGADAWSIFLHAAGTGAWDLFGTYAVTAP